MGNPRRRSGLLSAPLAAACLLAAGLTRAADAPLPEARMDQKLELLSAVRLLAGADTRFDGFFGRDLEYARAMRKHFKRFSKHPVVETYVRLGRRGFNENQGYLFLAGLSDPPELALRGEYPYDLADSAGGVEGLEELRRALAGFWRESDFPKFWSETAGLRERMLAGVAREARDLDCAGALAAYTGLPVRAKYTLILSPFSAPVAAGTAVAPAADGAPRVTSIFGPAQARKGEPVFYLSRIAGELWHQLALQQLGRDVRLEAAHEIAYAVGGRLVALRGDRSVEEWPVKYARFGMPHVGALMERLKEYEAARGRYPTLYDFLPRLKAVFEDSASHGEPGAPFAGGIRSLLSAEAPAVILPSSASDELKKAVRARWPGAEVLLDGDAAGRDLSDRHVVAVGMPRDNRWLSENWARLSLPLTLSRNSISFSREDEGVPYVFSGRLRLISVGRNPLNPARGALIYCASSEDLPGLLGLDPGAWDFAIYDADAPLKSGSYERSRLPWRVR